MFEAQGAEPCVQDFEVTQNARPADQGQGIGQRQVARQEQDAQVTGDGQHLVIGDIAPAAQQLGLALDVFAGEAQGLLAHRRCDQGIHETSQGQTVAQVQRGQGCATGALLGAPHVPGCGGCTRQPDLSAVRKFLVQVRRATPLDARDGSGPQGRRTDDDDTRRAGHGLLAQSGQADLRADAGGIAQGQGQERCVCAAQLEGSSLTSLAEGSGVNQR